MKVLLYILISFLIVKFSLKFMSRIKNRPLRITAKSLVISLFYAPSIVAIYIIVLPAPFIIAVPYYLYQAIQNKIKKIKNKYLRMAYNNALKSLISFAGTG